MLGRRDFQAAALGKNSDDFAEIKRMRPGQDGGSVLRRFKNIVASNLKQASPNECYIGQRIHGRQFSNTVEQKHSARNRRGPVPRTAPGKRKSHRSDQLRHLVKSLRMPWSEDHDSTGIVCQEVFESL